MGFQAAALINIRLTHAARRLLDIYCCTCYHRYVIDHSSSAYYTRGHLLTYHLLRLFFIKFLYVRPELHQQRNSVCNSFRMNSCWVLRLSPAEG